MIRENTMVATLPLCLSGGVLGNTYNPSCVQARSEQQFVDYTGSGHGFSAVWGHAVQRTYCQGCARVHDDAWFLLHQQFGNRVPWSLQVAGKFAEVKRHRWPHGSLLPWSKILLISFVTAAILNVMS